MVLFTGLLKRRSIILSVIWMILSALSWSIIVYSNNRHFELVLRILGLLVIPAFTGFGWRYIFEEKRNKVRFVTSWCLTLTVLYFLIGVVRVGFSTGGLTIYALTASTISIVVIYSLGYHKKRYSGIIIVANLIGYTLLSYLLLLEHLETGISIILQENDFLYLFLTDVTYFGIISTLTAHVFLLSHRKYAQTRYGCMVYGATILHRVQRDFPAGEKESAFDKKIHSEYRNICSDNSSCIQCCDWKLLFCVYGGRNLTIVTDEHRIRFHSHDGGVPQLCPHKPCSNRSNNQLYTDPLFLLQPIPHISNLSTHWRNNRRTTVPRNSKAHKTTWKKSGN